MLEGQLASQLKSKDEAIKLYQKVFDQCFAFCKLLETSKEIAKGNSTKAKAQLNTLKIQFEKLQKELILLVQNFYPVLTTHAKKENDYLTPEEELQAILEIAHASQISTNKFHENAQTLLRNTDVTDYLSLDKDDTKHKFITIIAGISAYDQYLTHMEHLDEIIKKAPKKLKSNLTDIKQKSTLNNDFEQKKEIVTACLDFLVKNNQPYTKKFHKENLSWIVDKYALKNFNIEESIISAYTNYLDKITDIGNGITIQQKIEHLSNFPINLIPDYCKEEVKQRRQQCIGKVEKSLQQQNKSKNELIDLAVETLHESNEAFENKTIDNGVIKNMAATAKTFINKLTPYTATELGKEHNPISGDDSIPIAQKITASMLIEKLSHKQAQKQLRRLKSIVEQSQTKLANVDDVLPYLSQMQAHITAGMEKYDSLYKPFCEHLNTTIKKAPNALKKELKTIKKACSLDNYPEQIKKFVKTYLNLLIEKQYCYTANLHEDNLSWVVNTYASEIPGIQEDITNIYTKHLDNVTESNALSTEQKLKYLSLFPITKMPGYCTTAVNTKVGECLAATRMNIKPKNLTNIATTEIDNYIRQKKDSMPLYMRWFSKYNPQIKHAEKLKQDVNKNIGSNIETARETLTTAINNAIQNIENDHKNPKRDLFSGITRILNLFRRTKKRESNLLTTLDNIKFLLKKTGAPAENKNIKQPNSNWEIIANLNKANKQAYTNINNGHLEPEPEPEPEIVISTSETSAYEESDPKAPESTSRFHK